MDKKITICEVCQEVEARYILEDSITDERNAYCAECLPNEYKKQL